ncbi:MAG: cytochrome D1 domain-containing protein, partial [Bacilli bacterium]
TNTFELEQGVFGFTLTNDGKRIFANNQFNSTVTVIDLEKGSIEKIIEGFSRPRQGIVVDSKDEFVYVTNFEGNDVRVINTKTLEIEKTLQGIPSVRAISVDKEGKYLYGASSSENTINVLDISTGEVVKSIKVGEEPYGSALSPDGKTILTGEKVSNQVSVIDTETLEVKNTIVGLNEPRQAIVYSSEEGQAYVLNADLSISIIDYISGNVIYNIVE